MKDIEAIKSRILYQLSGPRPYQHLIIGDDLNALLAKIKELESCLRWYVEEDDTNMTQPSNEYWIEGKHRAMRALGMEVE